ncbi:phage head-tail connector protein [Nocardia otitidiscaviarum]|uniref:phage head-tail connector protein n=1 Tax=Nocardia otitidiscaviarum TaxID=1823 RepID=UPI0004A75BF2|nr:phage head-tail connector protein [Nocardia otitidiscaviarum]MBF6483846.1 phage head-tail connector protein [Nocardia otitidiscaviarum]
MTAPVIPPAIDITAVKAYLRLTDDSDNDALTAVVDAVNDLMTYWFGSPAISAEGWPDRYVQGAVMLAARVYRRRNSPSGVESFGELGPLYVQRNDPDIAQLLGMGHYTRPAVG